MESKLRAVVFDFDGVIADSEPLHFRAFREILGEESVTLTREAYYSRYLGYDDVGVFRAVASDEQRGWSASVLADLVARKAVRLEALEQDVSVLFPGAAEAIRRLAASVPLAIASGALRTEILRVLERANLTHHFGAVVAAEDTAAGKPAPDPYLRAVRELAAGSGQLLKPAQCVAIEDSHWGLESARAAGLLTVAVTHSYPASALGGADLIVESLNALTIEILQQLFPATA